MKQDRMGGRGFWQGVAVLRAYGSWMAGRVFRRGRSGSCERGEASGLGSVVPYGMVAPPAGGVQWRGEGITSLRSHDAVGRIAALLIRDVVGQSL